jgi:hypothetical protein
MNKPTWLDLVIGASTTEIESLLRLAESIQSRHPNIGEEEELLAYATDAERESIRRIRERIERRLVASPRPVDPANGIEQEEQQNG